MRRKIGYIIALSALLISIPRYIATLDKIDPNSLTAYGMGILLAGGAAYIFDAWSDAVRRGMKDTWRLWIALGINLLYEPILLTPFVLSQLWEQPLAAVMGQSYAVFWSVMMTLAPVLLVGGVIYAISFQKQIKKQVEAKEQKGEDAIAELGSFTCESPGCSRSFATQRALNGHMKAHSNGHKKEKVLING